MFQPIYGIFLELLLGLCGGLMALGCSDATLSPYKMIKPTKLMKSTFWTEDQMDRFLEEGCSTARDRAFFAILRYLGVRPGSVYSLTVHDIDLVGRLMIFDQSVTKNGLTHYVGVPEPLHSILACYRPSSEALFPHLSERRDKASFRANLILRAACTRAGLPCIGIHDFRAAYYRNKTGNSFRGKGGES